MEHSRALQLIQELRGMDLPLYDRMAIERLDTSIRLPLSVVIAKVKGETLAQKAAIVGVSRQELWRWHTGRCRPKRKHAIRLSKLTGFPASSIYAD